MHRANFTAIPAKKRQNLWRGEAVSLASRPGGNWQGLAGTRCRSTTARPTSIPPTLGSNSGASCHHPDHARSPSRRRSPPKDPQHFGTEAGARRPSPSLTSANLTTHSTRTSHSPSLGAAGATSQHVRPPPPPLIPPEIAERKPRGPFSLVEGSAGVAQAVDESARPPGFCWWCARKTPPPGRSTPACFREEGDAYRLRTPRDPRHSTRGSLFAQHREPGAASSATPGSGRARTRVAHGPIVTSVDLGPAGAERVFTAPGRRCAALRCVRNALIDERAGLRRGQ